MKEGVISKDNGLKDNLKLMDNLKDNLYRDTAPRHIAVILDGNRRYAKKMGIPPFKGHEKGFNKISELLKWCVELGIKEVTLYCFSAENFNRDKTEVDYLFSLFRRKVNKLKKDKTIHANKVKVSVIGRIKMFPADIQKEINEITEMTKGYDSYKLNLALAYGSRGEIVDAVKRIVSSVKEANPIKDVKGIENKDVKGIGGVVDKVIDEIISKTNEDNIKANLYLSDDVDLVIRPGGEKRLSNFLLWQSSYAELIFTERLWPEFTRQDLIDCLEEYKKRERRFGK